jgi:hypothetical protein
MWTKMKPKLQPYNPAYFGGGASSYAAQGMCSRGCGKPALWMKGTRAYCEDHKPKE